MTKLKFDVDMIEAILVEQDPEGLISMGAPSDEYSSEAQMIHNRLTNEDFKDLNTITIKVIGVLFEMFAVSTEAYKAGVKLPGLHFDYKYVSFNDSLGLHRLKHFENIAKLIYNSGKFSK